MIQREIRIGVVGGSSCTPEIGRFAYEVGAELARRGAVLLCGGGGGVMERAAAGAHEQGGRTVGVLPGSSSSETTPNESIELPLFTGIGQARNLVLVLSSQAVIAVGGKWGTLSEIALALKHGVPVVLLESWKPLYRIAAQEPLVEIAATASEAVDLAVEASEGYRR